MPRSFLRLVALLAAVAPALAFAATPEALKFSFGPTSAAPGHTPVAPELLYSRERGHGFEPGASATSFHFNDRPPPARQKFTVPASGEFTNQRPLDD